MPVCHTSGELNQVASKDSMDFCALLVLGLCLCHLFSTEIAAVDLSPLPNLSSTCIDWVQGQGFLAVMRLNLTRPMEKPVDINGITSAPCIAPHITCTAAISNPLSLTVLSAYMGTPHSIITKHSEQAELIGCFATDSRQVQQRKAMQPCTLMVVQPALNRPLKPSVLKADLMTAPQKGATS